MSHRSPDELERDLAAWLDEEAAPMPDPLREIVATVPARHAQLGPVSGPDRASRLSRLTIGLAAAAVMIVAIVAAAGILRDFRASLGAPSSPLATPEVYVWDAVANFVAVNPARDAYGHDVVWSYLYGASGSREPTEFSPLAADSRQPGPRWHVPSIEGLYMGTAPGEPLLQMHPAGGRDGWSPILAWRNPIDDTPLTISGRVEVDGSCGDGITFIVDHAGDTFRSIELARGSESFSIPVERLVRGGVIHFIVEPGADSDCDTTWLAVRISND